MSGNHKRYRKSWANQNSRDKADVERGKNACQRFAIDFGFRPHAHYAEKFEKGFTLKTHQLFSVHITPANLKT